ncbi:MAG: class I SAM-dependent methyltransferase [Actinomycetota bacterium]|nr:class I SAM-dependent methyltransferase [Actinomycetota bacterium]
MRLRRDRSPERARHGLTRREPISRVFGFDRGKPIDRWYIERFLSSHADDVRGRVLEVAESTYTEWYGGEKVRRGDVLYASEGNPEATIVGDLTTGAGLPSEVFDCFICTQTLPFIYDVRSAATGCCGLLKPGGVLLATLPGISQISREDRHCWGDYWRFTTDSARRLFEEAFGPGPVEVTSHGNVLAAAGFLYGFAAEDMSEAELATQDPDYEMLITVRAVRSGRTAPG